METRFKCIGLDIGTAKVTEEEKKAFLTTCSIFAVGWTFTASDFKEKAEAAIAGITSRGKLPIIVDGTGLYIDTHYMDFIIVAKGRMIRTIVY